MIVQESAVGTVVVAAGVAFAGVVAVKVIQKKNPDFVKNLKKKTSNILNNAKASFKEGYATG